MAGWHAIREPVWAYTAPKHSLLVDKVTYMDWYHQYTISDRGNSLDIRECIPRPLMLTNPALHRAVQACHHHC